VKSVKERPETCNRIIRPAISYRLSLKKHEQQHSISYKIRAEKRPILCFNILILRKIIYFYLSKKINLLNTVYYE